MPTMTPLIRRFHKLAKRHHLSCALGRAIALTNRHYNDGRSRATDRESVARMKQFQLDTAKRWLLHWSEGGSVKVIGRSREQEAQRRKEYAQDFIQRNA